MNWLHTGCISKVTSMISSLANWLRCNQKRGCKIKQHPDLLYGSKQRCNVWASRTKHNHWSFPSYFVSECSCMHSMINNQTQLLRIQIGSIELQKPKLTSRIHKNCQRAQASWLQNIHQSLDSYILRSSPSHVHHHLLGQVAGAAENSNNQPSPLKQNSISSFTKIAREYTLPYFSMFIKDQTTT